MHCVKTLLIILLSLTSSWSYAQKKKLEYQDRTYENNIKTVQLFPNDPSIQAALEPSVIKLDDRNTLRLEFDDLNDDADYYYVYFIHCNYDWTPSDLRPNMYVNGYNEFEIVDFEFSSEARINYVHYTYLFPRFKTSGNYLAVVYRNQDKSDIVLSKRFYVYDNKVGLGARIDRSANVADRRSHQRIEATVNYSELSTIDPKEQFKVVVRQNERPDRTKALGITYIDDNAKLLKYQNLNENNEFPGGNEFRFFDLSTVNFGGRNVENTTFIKNKPYTKLRVDRPNDIAYLINLDLNGKFYIRDLEGRNSRLTSEYVDIQFSLDYQEIDASVYVIGGFNNWQKNKDAKMYYNPATDRYEQHFVLKQGWYDYTYVLASDENAIDKSFYETENLYEVFVYYKPMGGRGDLLVGYYKLNFNRRR